MVFLRYQEEWSEHKFALLQVLVSVPMLRDFCLELSSSHHLRLGPIGLALRELVQTVYGELAGGCLSHRQLTITEPVCFGISSLISDWKVSCYTG